LFAEVTELTWINESALKQIRLLSIKITHNWIVYMSKKEVAILEGRFYPAK